MKTRNAYIIGGGITGLSTAYNLSKRGNFNIFIFEKNKQIGGMATTFKHKDLILDLGPHKFFSNLKNREREVLKIIGKKNFLKIKKKSQIRLFNRFIDFPVGPIDILKINPITGILMGFGYATAVLKGIFTKKEEKTYKDYLINRFGSVAYNLTFAPYAKKIWAHPETLDKDLAATRVAAPNLFEMIKQMVFKIKSKSNTTISADFFHYPKYGSNVLLHEITKKLTTNKFKVQTSSNLESIITENNIVTDFTINDKTFHLKSNDVFISTIPIENLVSKNETLDKTLNKFTSKLKYKNMLLVYLVINKNQISDQNWYFFPEKKYIFNRVFEQKSFSKYMIPKNKTVMCCEITCDETDRIWNGAKDQVVISTVINQLVECRFFKKDDVIDSFIKRIDHAYPIYFVGYRNILNQIFQKLDSVKNLYSVGRQGGYNYVGMIDCYDIGVKTSDFIQQTSDIHNKRILRESFFNYVVID